MNSEARSSAVCGPHWAAVPGLARQDLSIAPVRDSKDDSSVPRDGMTLDRYVPADIPESAKVSAIAETVAPLRGHAGREGERGSYHRLVTPIHEDRMIYPILWPHGSALARLGGGA